MKTLFIVIATIALAGLASSCRNTVNTVSNAGVKAEITRINDLRVNTDSRLAKNLILTELRESQTDDGYNRVQVFLKNRTKSTYIFLYKFDWYDNHGVEVDNPDRNGWERKAVVAGDDVTLTSVAPQKNCGDFKLHLKAAD
jgi:uncharacterized protein YcfL